MEDVQHLWTDGVTFLFENDDQLIICFVVFSHG